jgi:hypothetical protein
MKKLKSTSITLSLAIIISLLVSPAAAFADKPLDLPEAPGLYSVPGHSELKLRVHVYNAKNNSKPSGGGATPQLNCSVTDPDSSTADGFTGWHLPTGTTTYRLNTSSAPTLIGASKMATLVDKAFGTWKNTTDVGSSVSFQKGANTSTSRSQFDGQNVVTWGRTSGSALAVTYTWYNASTGVVAENDTVFNSNFAWDWADQTASAGCAYQNFYDAQNILTHELGHWMGLNDNYDASFTNNTMYGYGSPTETKKDTLSTGDISAVNTIY